MELEIIRKKIEIIDLEILNLLNERMELALRTMFFKKEIEDREREDRIMENIRRFSRGLINYEFSSKIFKEIISESKRIQRKKMKLIAFQGEHGAYGEIAALSYDNSLLPIPCRDFVEIFEGIEEGYFNFGIVPVENSNEGYLTEVADLLIEKDLKVVGEVNLPVHYSLLTLPETDERKMKIVYSHPQALAQCRDFLYRNNLEQIAYYDTAGAARMLSRRRLKATGVIASKYCGELYGLKIVRDSIEDKKLNFTRFLVISNKYMNLNGNKISIVFSTENKPETLCRVLQLFSDVNLTCIISRLMKNDPGKYNFILDFHGSFEDKKIKKILKEIKKYTILFKFLGCYKEVKI